MGIKTDGGIAVAGSALVDEINEIKAYPEVGRLAQIYGVKRAAASLLQANATDGVTTKSEIYEITKNFKRR